MSRPKLINKCSKVEKEIAVRLWRPSTNRAPKNKLRIGHCDGYYDENEFKSNCSEYRFQVRRRRYFLI